MRLDVHCNSDEEIAPRQEGAICGERTFGICGGDSSPRKAMKQLASTLSRTFSGTLEETHPGQEGAVDEHKVGVGGGEVAPRARHGHHIGRAAAHLVDHKRFHDVSAAGH